MVTKFLGMKEFRQNMAKYTFEAKKKNTRFIILKKNVPVLEISPIDEKDFAYMKLSKELKESEEQIESGKFYTQEEVMKEFGLL